MIFWVVAPVGGYQRLKGTGFSYLKQKVHLHGVLKVSFNTSQKTKRPIYKPQLVNSEHG